jgi:hypothetical protein
MSLYAKQTYQHFNILNVAAYFKMMQKLLFLLIKQKKPVLKFGEKNYICQVQ